MSRSARRPPKPAGRALRAPSARDRSRSTSVVTGRAAVRAAGRTAPRRRPRARPGSRRGSRSRAAPIVPSARPRVSATPWYSGVSSAIGWRKSAAARSGRTCPLNRNSGVITNRNSRLKYSVALAACAVNAAIGVANARPVRIAAGIASTIAGESRRPDQRRDQDEDRGHDREPHRPTTRAGRSRCRGP